MRHLIATITFLAIGCTGSPATAPAASDAPHEGQSLSVSAVADALRASGLDVKPAGTLEQPFFSVPAQVFTVDGNDMQLYAFRSVEEAQSAAAQVAPGGGSIGTHAMAWMAPPHFFRKDRLIAIYIGNAAKTLAQLQRIFGPQFAGAASARAVIIPQLSRSYA